MTLTLHVQIMTPLLLTIYASQPLGHSILRASILRSRDLGSGRSLGVSHDLVFMMSLETTTLSGIDTQAGSSRLSQEIVQTLHIHSRLSSLCLGKYCWSETSSYQCVSIYEPGQCLHTVPLLIYVTTRKFLPSLWSKPVPCISTLPCPHTLLLLEEISFIPVSLIDCEAHP